MQFPAYPVAVSTWETRDNIGFLCDAFIARFWKRAEAEGPVDRALDTVLLRKAVEAGFS